MNKKGVTVFKGLKRGVGNGFTRCVEFYADPGCKSDDIHETVTFRDALVERFDLSIPASVDGTLIRVYSDDSCISWNIDRVVDGEVLSVYSAVAQLKDSDSVLARRRGFHIVLSLFGLERIPIAQLRCLE